MRYATADEPDVPGARRVKRVISLSITIPISYLDIILTKAWDLITRLGILRAVGNITTDKQQLYIINIDMFVCLVLDSLHLLRTYEAYLTAASSSWALAVWMET